MIGDDDLRDCFAMFALCGAIMRGESWTPKQIWEVADSMVEGRNTDEELGIAALKPKKKYARKET